MKYRGNCACCNRNFNGQTFKARANGRNIPPSMGALPYYSGKNNKICNACYNSHQKKLRVPTVSANNGISVSNEQHQQIQVQQQQEKQPQQIQQDPQILQLNVQGHISTSQPINPSSPFSFPADGQWKKDAIDKYCQWLLTQPVEFIEGIRRQLCNERRNRKPASSCTPRMLFQRQHEIDEISGGDFIGHCKFYFERHPKELQDLYNRVSNTLSESLTDEDAFQLFHKMDLSIAKYGKILFCHTMLNFDLVIRLPQKNDWLKDFTVFNSTQSRG
jgi:hypothetical protein